MEKKFILTDETCKHFLEEHLNSLLKKRIKMAKKKEKCTNY